MYFSYAEGLASTNVEKAFLLQRNGKKVTLLIIYYTSCFKEKYYQELLYK